MYESIIIIFLLIVLIALVLFRLPIKKDDSYLDKVIKKQEENLLSLNNDIQAFKEPMGKLRNFLSGSTSAGRGMEFKINIRRCFYKRSI